MAARVRPGTALPFPPPRRTALGFLGGLLVLSLAVVVLAFGFAQSQGAGLLPYAAYLLASALAFALALGMIGVIYALSHSTYAWRGSDLIVRLGLAQWRIPAQSIEWVRPADELAFPFKVPALHWPGLIVAQRDDANLGRVHFLATRGRDLVLVATPDEVFALSPADVHGFMSIFSQVNAESAFVPDAPLPVQLTRPHVHSDRTGRGLLLAAGVLGLVLLALCLALVPGRAGVSLGFDAKGNPLEAFPANRLLLLPWFDSIGASLDLAAGFFLFWRPNPRHEMAYFLWSAASVLAVLLLLAVLLWIL
jgi:hypothetical protein